MLKKLFILSCFGLVGLSGCSSATVDSDPVSYSLVAIDKAVETSMSMGVQGYSENHREFYSKPFQVLQSDTVMNSGFRDRGIAKVIVLGDSRPYTIEVEVYIERSRVSKGSAEGEYKFVRYDKRLANRLLKEILANIEHRDHDKNIIDDFRSF